MKLAWLMGVGLWLCWAAGAYEVMEVQGGGAIKGKVTYTGKEVKPRNVKVSKDQETCGHEPRVVPRVETGPENGLKNAFVVLEGVQKGKDFPKRESPALIDQHHCRFVPFIQVARTGEPILVRNSDDVLHNIQATQNMVALFNQAQPFKGLEFENKIEKPGPVSIKCNAHEWMEAYLWVSDHPYVAITDEGGNYELTGVPAGDYELLVWHPYLGEQTDKIFVSADETVSKDFVFEKRIVGRKR